MTFGNSSFFERKVIGDPKAPLLVRYIIFRLPGLGVYLHKLCRSDYDRALHDHPWPFVSIVLRGGYTEVHDQTIDGSVTSRWYPAGSVLVRAAEWRHRFILEKPAWTLVIVGRRQRRWGFFLPTGWCWWRKHNTDKGICEDQVIWTGGSGLNDQRQHNPYHRARSQGAFREDQRGV